MESLSGPEKERAWTAISVYVVLKTGGHVEETRMTERVSEILRRNGYEGFSSEEGMREQFKRWGLPDWILPAGGKLNETIHKPPDELTTPRQPQPSRESGRKLPPLSNAAALFRDTIDTLAAYLENLRYHQVILRDGRFVATDEIPKEAEMHPIVYIRSEYTAERWEEICAQHNKDPESTNEVYVYQDTSWSKGAAHYPPWFETCLITAVLMRSPQYVERLLKEINPEPDRVPRDQIYKLLFGRRGKGDGLYPAARNLARLIRGAEVKRGRSHASVPQLRQAQAQAIKEGREKGLTDEKIKQMLEVNEEEFESLEDLL
jgi:hypothetical protein